MTVKQFKIITGDEIICQVVEWADDDVPELVVRNALVIVSVDSPATGTRYYTFKPWITMQEGDECLITINAQDIVAQANPPTELLKYYYNAVNNANLTEQEIDDKVEKYIKKVKAMIEHSSIDSDAPNVIEFPGNTRIH